MKQANYLNLCTESFAAAYKGCATTLLDFPEYVTTPRGQKINEIIDASIVICDPTMNLFVNDVRSVPLKYLKDELKLYFSGTNSVEEFGNASKFWRQLSTDNKTVNSAYGYLLFKKLNAHGKTQWQWMIDSLKADSDSRQALMYLGGTDYQYDGVKDFVCTTSYHMFIRDNMLYMIVNRRSQDIFFGMTFDVPWELILMQCAVNELKKYYPNLGLGRYHLHCGSLHLYERNIESISKMLTGKILSASTPAIEESPILNTKLTNSEYIKADPFLTWLMTKENE